MDSWGKIVQKLSDSFGRDAKWSNGDAVTAADFVFGWQRAVDPATASEYSYMLSDIGQVVNLMKDIQQETGTAYLFIAHDLSMVKYISARIGVLHLGHLLETGTTE